MRIAALATAVALFTLVVPVAHADSTVDAVPAGVVWTGSPVNNNLTITVTENTAGPDQIVLSDPVEVMQVDAADQVACAGDNTNLVTCTREGLFVAADGEDGDDQLEVDGPGEHQLWGAVGSDQLTGSNDVRGEEQLLADSSFNGGPVGMGNDVVHGGLGPDDISGGNGDDQLFAGPGADRVGDELGNDSLDGGDGVDRLDLQAQGGGTLDLESGALTKVGPPPESNTATGFEDVNMSGTEPEQPLSLFGTASPNTIETAEGPDNVDARGGSDYLFLGGGADTVEARDGASDVISCGDGTDTVQADQTDVTFGCEAVTVSLVRAEGADLAPPSCSLGGVRARAKRSVLTRGLRPLVTCGEAATLEAQLTVRLRRVRGGKLIAARAGDLVLAEASGPAGAALPLRPLRRLRAKLPRSALRLRLVVRATDEFGNTTTLTRRVRVAAAKKPKRKPRRVAR